MFQLSHDAVDFFSVDFTAACTIVGQEQYPLGYFAAAALEVSDRLISDIEDAAKDFAGEAQMFFASRDASSAGMANEAYLRLVRLLQELPLYDILLKHAAESARCFSSGDGCKELWDEMTTPGTRSHIGYTNWISRICILGAELRKFQRNTQWMLTNYFEDLPAHRRENYIDAYGRFKDAIRNARLVDLDDEDVGPQAEPMASSFRFDFPAHISFVAYRDEASGKPRMAERSTFDDLVSFFYLDLTRGIAAGNLPRRCRHCHRWFVAVGGYNTQYCDRLLPDGSGRSCRNVGAHETAKRKLSETAAREYARTYNRLKARKQRGALTTDEWNRTVAAAEDLRADFQHGKLTESEYCRKLKAM